MIIAIKKIHLMIGLQVANLQNMASVVAGGIHSAALDRWSQIMKQIQVKI